MINPEDLVGKISEKGEHASELVEGANRKECYLIPKERS